MTQNADASAYYAKTRQRIRLTVARLDEADATFSEISILLSREEAKRLLADLRTAIKEEKTDQESRAAG